MTEQREPPLLSYEQKKAIKDRVEEEYKERKGYKGFNWAYSEGDRFELTKEYELALIQTQWESDKKWMKENCYLKAERELPENPYHPNPLREYDHQITQASKDGYDQAQQDMLRPNSEGIAYRAYKEMK